MQNKIYGDHEKFGNFLKFYLTNKTLIYTSNVQACKVVSDKPGRD